MDDPTTKYPKPPYKKQSQPWPGLASKMEPPPDHGEESYRGSNRLGGRKALITGTFSVWLLTAGLIMAALAVVAGLIDWIGSRRINGLAPVWPRLLGRALVVVLSLINVFVHSRDGYTAVVPQGLILSGFVVLIMAITGWVGVAYVRRRPVGIVR
jgi:uncharacterized membrane protein